MQKDYIILEPTQPKGKLLVAAWQIGGKYRVICECRSQWQADLILRALQNDSFNGKLLASYRQAAE